VGSEAREVSICWSVELDLGGVVEDIFVNYSSINVPGFDSPEAISSPVYFCLKGSTQWFTSTKPSASSLADYSMVPTFFGQSRYSR
jgi:hypothetical protein